jgi:hypothetical protein
VQNTANCGSTLGVSSTVVGGMVTSTVGSDVAGEVNSNPG